jgi:hypothetical protein
VEGRTTLIIVAGALILFVFLINSILLRVLACLNFNMNNDAMLVNLQIFLHVVMPKNLLPLFLFR